jgi:SsrA-binding protein
MLFTFSALYAMIGSMKIFNRKAPFEYEILDRLEAGINLTGPEVKAVRLGHVDLASSFVRIVGSEAYLVNAKIFPYQYARNAENFDPSRTRKLLLHKKEIISLKSKLDGEKLSLVPVSLYTTKRLIKLELALGKGKKSISKERSD